MKHNSNVEVSNTRNEKKEEKMRRRFPVRSMRIISTFVHAYVLCVLMFVNVCTY